MQELAHDIQRYHQATQLLTSIKMNWMKTRTSIIKSLHLLPDNIAKNTKEAERLATSSTVRMSACLLLTPFTGGASFALTAGAASSACAAQNIISCTKSEHFVAKAFNE